MAEKTTIVKISHDGALLYHGLAAISYHVVTDTISVDDLEAEIQLYWSVTITPMIGTDDPRWSRSLFIRTSDFTFEEVRYIKDGEFHAGMRYVEDNVPCRINRLVRRIFYLQDQADRNRKMPANDLTKVGLPKIDSRN